MPDGNAACFLLDNLFVQRSDPAARIAAWKTFAVEFRFGTGIDRSAELEFGVTLSTAPIN